MLDWHLVLVKEKIIYLTETLNATKSKNYKNRKKKQRWLRIDQS